MTKILAIKTKIYPTKTQKDYFNRCFGIRRFAWNWGLEHWEEYKSRFKLDKVWNHNFELKENKPYLYEVNSMVKQMAFKDLSEAWYLYFKDVKNVGKPLFKSKKKDTNRFSMNMKANTATNKTIKFNGKWIDMNGTRKLGRLRFKSAENLDFLNNENIRIAEWTISERAGDYYISIIYERTNHKKININQICEKIGIDCGIKTMLTSWNGSNYSETNLPKKILYLENKLDYLNKNFSKKAYNSHRFNLMKKQINKLYLRIANIKKDFMYKIINFLVKTYKQINYETYDFKLDSNLKYSTRKLYRLAPFKFTELLKRKCEDYKVKLNIIKGEPTTQTCSCCGYRYINKEKLTLKDRIFICKNCGYEDGRDMNSAKNIFKFV